MFFDRFVEDIRLCDPQRKLVRDSTVKGAMSAAHVQKSDVEPHVLDSPERLQPLADDSHTLLEHFIPWCWLVWTNFQQNLHTPLRARTITAHYW